MFLFGKLKNHFYTWLELQAEKCEFVSRKIEITLVEHNPRDKIIDLGCGDGSFTLQVAQKVGITNIVGLDIDERNVAQALSSRIIVSIGDLNQSLPFQESYFDGVIASHVIEHLNDTDNFLKEIFRILKSGGYLILATPNLASWHNIILLSLGKQPTVAEVSDHVLVGTWSPRQKSLGRVGPAHRRIFTVGAINELLEHYGFKIEKCIGTGIFPFLTNSILTRINKNHATNIVIKAFKP